MSRDGCDMCGKDMGYGAPSATCRPCEWEQERSVSCDECSRHVYYRLKGEPQPAYARCGDCEMGL